MPTRSQTFSASTKMLNKYEDQAEISLVRLDILDLSEVLARIESERVRLHWQREELQQYCLDQYGQIRA